MDVRPKFDPELFDLVTAFSDQRQVTIESTAINYSGTPEDRKHLSAYFEGPLPEDPREKAQKYLVYLLVLGSDYSLPRTSLDFLPSPQTNILDELGIESIYQLPLPPQGRPGMSKYSTERFNPRTNKKEYFYVIVNRDSQGFLHTKEDSHWPNNISFFAVQTCGHCVHSPKLRQSWHHGSLQVIHGNEVSISCTGKTWQLFKRISIFNPEYIRDLTARERLEISRILEIW